MAPDEHYLSTCLELARLGAGSVSPNPLVGCVIVKGRKIIGSGYHQRFGEPHAEINALASCTSSPRGATLYVNLEPCSHFGKTPPCADAVIRAGISRVVIGTEDPNPLVSGRGTRKLRRHGIKVDAGVLADECAELNKFFFTRVRTGLPYVTVKIAQTIDGKIADVTGRSKWITSPDSRKKVHALRAGYDAVLTGIGTVLRDNPSLTVRDAEGRDPKPVILDTKLRFPPDCKLARPGTIIFTSEESRKKASAARRLIERGVEIQYLPRDDSGHVGLRHVLSALTGIGTGSVLVEGGAEICNAFLYHELADELLVFIAPKIMGVGIPAVEFLGGVSLEESLQWKLNSVTRFGEDVLLDLRKIRDGLSSPGKK